MAAWPASLTKLSHNMDVTQLDGSVRTPMDAGPSKVRRRFSAVPFYFQMTLAADDTELATFETFYADTVEQGSLPFDFVDPRNGVTKSCRFAAAPSYSSRKGSGGVVTLWVISMLVEVLP